MISSVQFPFLPACVARRCKSQQEVKGTYQVHTVPRTRNQTSIRQGVHRRKLVERDRLVHVMDGHEFDGPETPVDPADKLVNACSEVLVFFYILSRRDGKLDKNDLGYQLGSPIGPRKVGRETQS